MNTEFDHITIREDTHSNEILSNVERIALVKAIQERKSPPHKMEITPEMKKAIFNFLNLP